MFKGSLECCAFGTISSDEEIMGVRCSAREEKKKKTGF